MATTTTGIDLGISKAGQLLKAKAKAKAKGASQRTQCHGPFRQSRDTPAQKSLGRHEGFWTSRRPARARPRSDLAMMAISLVDGRGINSDIPCEVPDM